MVEKKDAGNGWLGIGAKKDARVIEKPQGISEKGNAPPSRKKSLFRTYKAVGIFSILVVVGIVGGFLLWTNSKETTTQNVEKELPVNPTVSETKTEQNDLVKTEVHFKDQAQKANIQSEGKKEIAYSPEKTSGEGITGRNLPPKTDKTDITESSPKKAKVAGTEGRHPLLMEGKKTLFQRVLTRPGAILTTGCKNSENIASVWKKVDPFTIFFVYDRKTSAMGQNWV